MSGEGLCNWEQLDNHSGRHISLLLVPKQVLEEVVVGLDFLEEHRRNILPLPELEQLLQEEEEMVALDILGLEDSHVVVFALEIRNGLQNSALQVLEQLLG